MSNKLTFILLLFVFLTAPYGLRSKNLECNLLIFHNNIFFIYSYELFLPNIFQLNIDLLFLIYVTVNQRNKERSDIFRYINDSLVGVALGGGVLHAILLDIEFQITQVLQLSM